MYGIPDGFPFDKLVGATLMQVCTGEYQIQLHFDGMQSVSIESSLRINDSGNTLSDFAEASTLICRFLGDTILQASAPDKKTLRLVFSKGSMEIFDDTDRYEAFQVSIPEIGLFIV